MTNVGSTFVTHNPIKRYSMPIPGSSLVPSPVNEVSCPLHLQRLAYFLKNKIIPLHKHHKIAKTWKLIITILLSNLQNLLILLIISLLSFKEKGKNFCTRFNQRSYAVLICLVSLVSPNLDSSLVLPVFVFHVFWGQLFCRIPLSWNLPDDLSWQDYPRSDLCFPGDHVRRHDVNYGKVRFLHCRVTAFFLCN